METGVYIQPVSAARISNTEVIHSAHPVLSGDNMETIDDTLN